MMTELEKSVELGSELDFNVKLEDGKAVIELEHEGTIGFAKIQVGVDAVKLVDKLTDLIPGEMDDALLDTWVARLVEKKTIK